jgi:ABC-2 type transport system ATP-binding protein
MVQFSEIGKDFGELTALEDVSFSIPRGGIVGLLGPNGAGKTTTMRIMTGYLEPTRGAVTIADTPFGPDSVEPKRQIGYLPESAPAYGDMLAWDYLSFAARVHGLDPAVRVPEVIREAGLQSHAHMPIRTLSKGFQQRVGIANTLIHDPELLVLDEPTSGLDPNQILEVRELIRRIAQTKTVILSTHIMQEVEALCRRVIVIHRGSIRYDGSIDAFAPSVQRIRLIVSGADNATLGTHLSTIAGLRSVEQAELPPSDQQLGLHAVTVNSDPEVDLRPEVFRLAKEGAFDIYEMTRERTSMEDIFRELTQEATNE